MDEYIRTGDNVNKCSGYTAAPLSPLRLSLYQEASVSADCTEDTRAHTGHWTMLGGHLLGRKSGNSEGRCSKLRSNTASNLQHNLCKHQAARGGLWLVAYGVRQLTCYLVQFYMFLL